MGVPGNANALLLRTAVAAETGISRSLRFNSADSANLSKTFGSAGNQKTYTLSMWIKRSTLGAKYFFGSYFSNLNRYQYLGFNSSDQLEFFGGVYTTGGSTSTNVNLSTTAVYRDVSAWYHIVLAVDTTQATNTNRVKLYVNGTQVTAFGTATYPAQNTESYINSVQAHYLGDWGGGGSLYLDGYLADCFLIDGQALDPTSFGETDATTGVWNPKAYTGSYGTNGFHLEFADNSAATATTLGKDTSGNGNNWTPNNLSVTAGAGNDSLVDVPTNGSQTDTGVGGEVRGNYCTWNPLSPVNSIYTNGNLDVTIGSNGRANSTFSASSGKWYWEATMTTQPSVPSYGLVGIGSIGNTGEMGNSGSESWGYRDDGLKRLNNSATSYGASYTVGDVIGIAWDADNGTLTFYKNGVSQGQAFTGVTGNYGPVAGRNGNPEPAYACNFGQRPFAYTAPSGFKALCTTNLPAPSVTKSSTVFDVKLYSGTGSTQSITGLGFSPDLVWLKARSISYSHQLYDVIRGTTNALVSNTTAAEAVYSGGLTAFNSDGFTIGNDGGINQSSNTFVAWAWDAGSSTVTNTAGSITTSCRANTSAGFSVATWTGSGSGSASVGHGLGVAPRFMIIKDRSLARNWLVYHTSLGATSGLALNSTTAASGADAGWWNNTAPTSTVATIGIYGNEASNYVGYFWTPVVGYSNAFTWSGTGSTDGPAIYLGFRARFLIWKRTDSAANWAVLDTARSSFNVSDDWLGPNSSSAEAADNAAYAIDVLSNGLKIRATHEATNQSGGTYIGFAWAESPFNYARAR